jgi:uncharacterized protein
MSLYYLVMLMRGPNWTPDETPELEHLQESHQAHLRQLHESGHLIVMGPLLDGGHIRGISIFKTTSAKEARALTEADPSVQAGRFTVELHSWMVPQGILPS